VEELDNEDEAAGESGQRKDKDNKANGEIRHPVKVEQEITPVILLHL